MTVTIPLFAILAVIAFICCRFLGLRFWHLLVCLLLGFLLAATSAAPEIQNLLNSLMHAGRK